MKKDHLNKTKTPIRRFFKKSKEKIFSYSILSRILNDNKKNWSLSENTNTSKFINFLIQTKILKNIELDFPYRKASRYITNDKLSIFQILLSIDKNAYFTHSSALFFHKFIATLPDVIYLNIEQKEHHFNRSTLKQSNIDLAFSRKQKISNNVIQFQQHKVRLLNGKHTKKLGVIAIKIPKIGPIITTTIERTLIDLTVRPVYAGGVSNVLTAYKKAKKIVSIKKLADILVKLDYIYPYHQAIGFYLDNSKVYDETDLNLFKKFGLEYDFYLTHNISKKNYSKEWKIYYPANLDK